MGYSLQSDSGLQPPRYSLQSDSGLQPPRYSLQPDSGLQPPRYTTLAPSYKRVILPAYTPAPAPPPAPAPAPAPAPIYEVSQQIRNGGSPYSLPSSAWSQSS